MASPRSASSALASRRGGCLERHSVPFASVRVPLHGRRARPASHLAAYETIAPPLPKESHYRGGSFGQLLVAPNVGTLIVAPNVRTLFVPEAYLGTGSESRTTQRLIIPGKYNRLQRRLFPSQSVLSTLTRRASCADRLGESADLSHARATLRLVLRGGDALRVAWAVLATLGTRRDPAPGEPLAPPPTVATRTPSSSRRTTETRGLTQTTSGAAVRRARRRERRRALPSLRFLRSGGRPSATRDVLHRSGPEKARRPTPLPRRLRVPTSIEVLHAYTPSAEGPGCLRAVRALARPASRIRPRGEPPRRAARTEGKALHRPVQHAERHISIGVGRIRERSSRSCLFAARRRAPRAPLSHARHLGAHGCRLAGFRALHDGIAAWKDAWFPNPRFIFLPVSNRAPPLTEQVAGVTLEHCRRERGCAAYAEYWRDAEPHETYVNAYEAACASSQCAISAFH